MRKIVLNLAISLDGYISDEKGGFDWIVGHGDHSLDTTNGEQEFQNFLKTVDTIVMGSKAYEDCILSGLASFDDKEIIVATTRELEKRENVRFISGDICEEISKLKEVEGKDIFLFGGAGLTDSFIKSNIIYKYIVGIIPIILGNGRRLFKGDYPKIDLKLEKLSITDGITLMTYSKR